MMDRIKDLRYQIMLALYMPILLYAFSTFDLSEESYAVQSVDPVVTGQQTVVLGQPFQAKAFLSVGREQGQQLSASGDLQAVGDTAFQMQTNELLSEGEDEKTVSYDGTFRFQQVDGEVSRIPVSGQFRVRRPEIVATSENAQSLYRRCLNRLRIRVPGLENRTLRLEYGGQSTEGQTIALSPGGKQSTVDVYLADSTQSDDVYLGQKQFSVISPPRPDINVRNAGRDIQNGDNLPKRRASLNFSFKPDEEFRSRFPQDARYRASRATVFLRQGLAASEKLGTFDLSSDGRLVLTRQLRNAEPGDQITVRLEGVVRINHAGAAIPLSLNEASRTYGFIVS
ncbi:MAG: hypothetical protein BRD40_04080 [Bacteroidetes bacterium QS_1_65_9]|nr:MAG: hypothetical protein BRD40_04080 [Bacteroidetes bacterium QS_1_65_9]